MKKYSLHSIVLALFIVVVGCVKNDKIAPDLKQVSGPVLVAEAFSASTTTPDFGSNQRVTFSARFENDTYWEITIVGANSGATKKIQGTGNSITAQNASWDGTADGLPSFRAESVEITVSFPSSGAVTSSAPLMLNATISSTKDLDAGHVLITDFSVNKIQNVFNGNFGAVPSDRWPSNFAVTAVQNDAPFKNPDGNQYCIIGPQPPWENNLDSPGNIGPYIDHLNITATSVGYPNYFPLIADQTKIYFNMMVHNNALPTFTWIQITLYEDDPALGAIAKSYNLYPDWSNGWKLVTLPYSLFVYGDGTRIVSNPQTITGLQITLLSSAPQSILNAGTNPVSAKFDHLIFTHYRPYQP